MTAPPDVTSKPDAERAQLVQGMVEAYARGDGIQTIAAATGHNRRVVRRLLVGAGVRLRAPGKWRPAITDADTANWVAAYTRGDSTTTIAANAGRHRGTVSLHLVRAGVTLRPARLKNEQKRLQPIAVDAYTRGDSIRTIAAATGQGYGVVRNALLAAGVTLRAPGGSRERRTDRRRTPR